MRIAIVGTGISALTSAHHLYKDHEIDLFEATDWIGGHTHTVDVEQHGLSYAVDTGFIVFQRAHLPKLSQSTPRPRCCLSAKLYEL